MKTSILKNLSLLFVLSLAITSCMKNSTVAPTTATEERRQAPQLFSVMDYDLVSETGKLAVAFYESQRFYTMDVSSKNFETVITMISESKEQHVPIRVSLSGTHIDGVTAASAADLKQYRSRFEDETDLLENNYKKVIPSMDVLNDIFQFCADQNCEDGNAVIDYCIPFQYKIDGCYARAHKMRQILADYYGYECGKIFSESGLVHPLAVNAGDCCVFWGWHEAPVVTVNTSEGVQTMVIDPSLFTSPVDVDTWLSVQSDTTCDKHAKLKSYQITPGSWYFSDGSKDPRYIFTNSTLELYRDLQTCD